MPAPPIVVEVVRGDVVESVHQIDAVVVDADGAVVQSFGDADRPAYFRSSLKPVQAGVSVAQGWKPPGEEEIAVACSSHNAEEPHLAAVRSILSTAGLTEDDLRCPPALPLYPPAAAKAGEPKRILRDCSGKHAAFLAACVANQWPLDSYLDPAHPIQRAVLDRARELCGGDGPVGVDGCGAATIAFPLARIALGFTRGITAEPRIASAMTAHPFLVAGTDRICTDAMRAAGSDLVLKAGAEGLLCFASPARAVGGVLKVRDGAARANSPASVWLLGRLGLIAQDDPALHNHVLPVVLGGGRPAGLMRIAP